MLKGVTEIFRRKRYIQKDGTWLPCDNDITKNVSDVFYRLNSNGIGAGTSTHSDSSASFDIVSLNPFRFSSEYYDPELDLVYYNYRHYSPSLGRFLSRDPIAEQGGLNLYRFINNRGERRVRAALFA
ncbi:MAG: RHS repeat-associated core domain-containing protein [Verrucomicrobia bacterium]|nr:RHS repeat-associated core domain-containing protein [Verrucomicrobiota bacterium]